MIFKPRNEEGNRFRESRTPAKRTMVIQPMQPESSITISLIEVRDKAMEICRRQGVTMSQKKFRALATHIETLQRAIPDPSHVREIAIQNEIILTKKDLEKMCWILQAVQIVMNGHAIPERE